MNRRKRITRRPCAACSNIIANAAQAAAQVTARNSDASRAGQDYNRRVALSKAGAVAAEQVTDYRNTYETAQANLVAAKQTLASQQALIRGTDIAHNPEVLAAKAAVDTATLNQSRTFLRAPFDGVIAQKTAQIGERVQVGQALMSVVPVNRAYVDANFKEGQLTKVHAGQSGRTHIRSLRLESGVSRPGAGTGRRHRFGVRRHPGAKRDRQLDQGCAAAAGARRARSAGAWPRIPCASACR